MTKKQRAKEAVWRLETLYPQALCALEWQEEPWRLLVMGRLSAQCTDARVNIVCKELFTVYSTPKALAEAPLPDIEKIIRPCGLFRTKAESIKSACKKLVEEFDSVLPSDMDVLLTFPGVGRKIANLLRGDVFHLGGIVADTHCIRISARLGLTAKEETSPVKTEKALVSLIPLEKQSDFCHRIVMFGRDICTARSPKCENCPLADICAQYTRNFKNKK
ncbi:MAG: endonuclease III [Ruminococcaceae bacterium]|nr:endonuclease III [Oscillospiraceae bacterium]